MSDVWSITHNYRDTGSTGIEVELFPSERSAKSHMRGLWRRHIDESNHFEVRELRVMKLERVKLSKYEVTPVGGSWPR